MKNKKNSLGVRLIQLFAAITIPLLSVLFAGGYYAKENVLAQVSRSYQNLVNSNLKMMERSLEDITINLVDIVDHDENFLQFNRPGLKDSDYYFARMGIMQRNQAYQAYYHSVDMFYLYSGVNDMLTLSNVLGNTEEYMDEIRAWITGKVHNEDKMEPLRYKWTIVNIAGDYYINRTVGNNLSNPSYIGALIRIDSMRSPLGNLNLQSGGDVLIVDNEGNILTSSSKSMGYDFKLPHEKMNQNSSFSYMHDGRKWLVVSSQSSTLGINLSVVIPDSELLQGLNTFQMIINVLPFFILIILLVYLYYFRRIVIRPILDLLGGIHRIRKGSMEAQLPSSNLLEFQALNQAFNTMVVEIQNLKIDVYEERLNAQKAEMKHLQMQINPHFFLNTLNIIFQLADLKRFELVKKTVRHLVQYFRFMLQVKDNSITLEQELDHLRNYLEIQKMRYQQSFDFQITIDEDIILASIPSLIVQPFVENAMLHGISLKAETFYLEICAVKSEENTDTMIIEISDNGRGSTQQKLQELNSPDYRPETDDGHIGIWNVKQRLAMRYQGKANIHFSENEPSGFRVRLSLPIEYMEGE
ncbi:histidine kinase [Paenibacillus sp. FSL L8-0323]|uniref:Helicase Ski2 n=1 Tax=Paenibacillus odorifer TaxID=189426 RepID=A0A1R0Y1H1_9BACL|nr:sensor histidine kinase [Paenibacillus odorifer]OMD13001.1 helicase Ski2 [Paenibacillus odorifer]OMD21047.1 helicase Ski2 [Paenibacillus odorifer]OMD41152.1 helicase Ski2 [Paenibacillus odorifer]